MVVREGLIKRNQSKRIVKKAVASVGRAVRLLHCNGISFQIRAISTPGLATALSRPNAIKGIKAEASLGLMRISKLTSSPLSRVFSFAVKHRLILSSTEDLFYFVCVCLGSMCVEL